MTDWKSAARQKFNDFAAEAAASTGRYRAVIDRTGNLSAARRRASDYLQSLKYSQVHVEPAKIEAAKTEVADLDRSIAEMNEQARRLELKSSPAIRLANESKKILLDLGVISKMEGAA